MKVLAIDPGERVGWAVGTIAKGSDGSYANALTVESHGISALKPFALALFKSVVTERKYDAIVFETFRVRPNKAKSFIGSELPTVQLVGMIRLCAWIAGIALWAQSPGDKTSARMSLKNPAGAVIRDLVAKAEAVAHDDGHDGDALLHLWWAYFSRFV